MYYNRQRIQKGLGYLTPSSMNSELTREWRKWHNIIVYETGRPPRGSWAPRGGSYGTACPREDVSRWVHARVFDTLDDVLALWGWHLMTVKTRRWLARANSPDARRGGAGARGRRVAQRDLVAFAAVGVCCPGGRVLVPGQPGGAAVGRAGPGGRGAVLILVAFAVAPPGVGRGGAVALRWPRPGPRGPRWAPAARTRRCRLPAARPRRPFLIMNPRSGGGKVTRFGLQDKAEALGAEVALLEGPGMVDVAALARQTVADGADLLGVAGGDGTQALVAGIAAEHGLPFLVISAGTRNHFALDLGLDREDPATCLDALTDGEELRVDLGVIADRTFVNNASFGAYAEVVRSPAYRDDKRGTTLQMLPELLNGHQGAGCPPGPVPPDRGPQALLVSNGPYEMSDVAGLGRRARLDAGTLGVVAVRVDSARQAAGSCGGARHRADHAHRRGGHRGRRRPQIPVGIDGETVMLPAPVRCTIRPRALRVVVPRNVPVFPLPRRPWNGRGCGTWPPSAPSHTASPVPARPGREPSPQPR